MNQESENKSKNVVELSSFRKKKETAEEFARGRSPLYVSHTSGKISGSKEAASEDTFGDRYQRIKSSLEKINRLMAELKKISSTGAETVEAKSTTKTGSKQV
jgi:hypothetical protein